MITITLFSKSTYYLIFVSLFSSFNFSPIIAAHWFYDTAPSPKSLPPQKTNILKIDTDSITETYSFLNKNIPDSLINLCSKKIRTLSGASFIGEQWRTLSDSTKRVLTKELVNNEPLILEEKLKILSDSSVTDQNQIKIYGPALIQSSHLISAASYYALHYNTLANDNEANNLTKIFLENEFMKIIMGIKYFEISSRNLTFHSDEKHTHALCFLKNAFPHFFEKNKDKFIFLLETNFNVSKANNKLVNDIFNICFLRISRQLKDKQFLSKLIQDTNDSVYICKTTGINLFQKTALDFFYEENDEKALNLLQEIYKKSLKTGQKQTS